MDVNLVLFKNDGSQATFPLPDGVAVLGRSHDCELRIPLKIVSRKHCQFSPNKESLKIQDLDSRIGTFLNGRRITAETVRPGDYIRIGPLTFQIQIGGKPEAIVPPEARKRAPAAKKPSAPRPHADQPSGSFPELELDGSDSFLAELDDL
ncbi:MAG: FHA domain-containing protein [Planctomycetota bacterium]|jgi:pSer/pThr/pTyr-binding forkhead associated (FHA) protein